jgi:hypothetical protein
VLVINSFDKLLHNNVVFAMEKLVPEYREVMVRVLRVLVSE